MAKKTAKKTATKTAKKAVKKVAKKAAKKTVKKAAKKVAKKAAKKAAKKTLKTTKSAQDFNQLEIATEAYYVYQERMASNTPGSEAGDWATAIQRLISAS